MIEEIFRSFFLYNLLIAKDFSHSYSVSRSVDVFSQSSSLFARMFKARMWDEA